MTAICLIAIGTSDALQGFTCQGFDDDRPARAIGVGDFHAVTVEVDEAVFLGPGSEDRLKDVQWLTPIAQRHDAIVRAAMQRGPVMPVGFGSIFTRTDALAESLAAHAEAIESFLENTAGCSEYSLRAWTSRKQAIQWARDAIAGSQNDGTDGTAYLQSRRLDGEAERLAEDHALAVIDDIIDGLGETVRDLAERPPITTTDDADPDQWQIAHAALLVPDDAKPSFDALLDELAPDAEAEGLTLELSGPWPPFSFCPRFDTEAPVPQPDNTAA